MYDAFGFTATQVLITSTNTFTATLDLGPSLSGTPRRGYVFNGQYTGATAVANGTASWAIYHGTATGASLRALANSLEAPVALPGGVSGQFHIPFSTDLRYVAVVLTFAGTGAASIPWQGDVTYARPA